MQVSPFPLLPSFRPLLLLLLLLLPLALELLLELLEELDELEPLLLLDLDEDLDRERTAIVPRLRPQIRAQPPLQKLPSKWALGYQCARPFSLLHLSYPGKLVPTSRAIHALHLSFNNWSQHAQQLSNVV